MPRQHWRWPCSRRCASAGARRAIAGPAVLCRRRRASRCAVVETCRLPVTADLRSRASITMLRVRVSLRMCTSTTWLSLAVVTSNCCRPIALTNTIICSCVTKPASGASFQAVTRGKRVMSRVSRGSRGRNACGGSRRVLRAAPIRRGGADGPQSLRPTCGWCRGWARHGAGTGARRRQVRPGIVPCWRSGCRGNAPAGFRRDVSPRE